MTYREKLAEEHPQHISDLYGGGCYGCPHEYGYTFKTEDVSTMGCANDGACDATCAKCWDREMPDKCPIDIRVGDTGVAIGKILDSGDRTEFASGAVRDMREGKGRCDLMPLEVVAEYLTCSLGLSKKVLEEVANFKGTGYTLHLYLAIGHFVEIAYGNSDCTMLLEVAKHFEEGAKKYGENNWQKGIPVHCYIDSAVRHYLKWLRGDQDEPHDRAFVWNLMCCIWEVDYHNYCKEDIDGCP